MDLRTRKTLRSIHQAFKTLRKGKPLERITVKELAELAEISKATFYLHYKDIYDLSDHLQRQVIEKILDSITHPDRYLTDVESFTHSLYISFLEHEEEIDILFSGVQASVLPHSIERGIRERILRISPALEHDPGFRIRLTYQVYGGCYAFNEYRGKVDVETLVDTISHNSALLSGDRLKNTKN